MPDLCEGDRERLTKSEQKGGTASKVLRIGARVFGVAFTLCGLLTGMAIFSKPSAGLGPNILMAGFTIMCFIITVMLSRVAAGKKIVEGDGAHRRRGAGASALPANLKNGAAERKLPVPSGLERFRRSPDGGVYLWADDEERSAAGCGILFGVPWTLMMVWMIWTSSRDLEYEHTTFYGLDWFEFLSWFVLLEIVFLVLGLILIVQGIAGVRVNGVLEGVRVSALEHPLWPGRRVELVVSLTGRTARSALAQCELVLREVAREQAGSNTVTKDAVILTLQPATVTDERADDGKRKLRVTFDLPVDVVPSFESTNNKLQWAVVINLRRSETGRPITGRWPIVVLPTGVENTIRGGVIPR